LQLEEILTGWVSLDNRGDEIQNALLTGLKQISRPNKA
jgi:hypothetical protein